MNLIEHIGCRRSLSVLVCLGISISACGLEKPLRPPSVLADRGSRDAAASATEEGGATAMPAPDPDPIAMVNGKPISLKEFNTHYAEIMRKRFWHGKPPEEQVEAVRKEIIDLLVEDELLVEEAKRRGFRPNEADIEQIVADMDARYGAKPAWKKDRELALSAMRADARSRLVEQAKKVLHDIPQPTPAQVRAYYEQKPELFTEPGKQRLSMILLKVDPGAPDADWARRREEAQELYLRLKDGAEFTELARQYSDDKSADSGGYLGYLHGGMLPEKLQNSIDKSQVGVVAEPFTMLEGIALYRLDERVAPVLREFTEVEPRAQELFKRDLESQVWTENISRLRGDAKIEIFMQITNGGKQSDSSKAP